MKKIKVVFVCKANEERSPTAEAFAKAFIEANNLQDRIEVSSAGIYVDHIVRILRTDDINDHFVPNLLKVFVTEKALENETFDEEHAKKVRFLLTKGNFDQVELNKLYLFAKREAMARTRTIYITILEKKNLKIKYYHPDQLVPKDYDYIIPMMEDEAIEVKKIFFGTRYEPKIVLLHEFIGIAEECPIVVTSKDPKLYESLYKYMKANIPILIKRILEMENDKIY